MELASLAQLERSHRRHDEVMGALLEAARRLAAGRPNDGDVQLVHEAVAFFDRAVTRHFLDEEGSVFPRLSTRRPELAADLATLSAEHPIQIQMQSEVATAAQELGPDPRPAIGLKLLEAVMRLADAHRSHVEREDQIFAAAHEALTAEDDTGIIAEMATRRDREIENGRGLGEGRGMGGGGGGGGGGGRGRGMGGGGGRGRGMGGGDGGGGGGGGGRGGGGGGGRGGRGGGGMGGDAEGDVVEVAATPEPVAPISVRTRSTTVPAHAKAKARTANGTKAKAKKATKKVATKRKAKRAAKKR